MGEVAACVKGLPIRAVGHDCGLERRVRATTHERPRPRQVVLQVQVPALKRIGRQCQVAERKRLRQVRRQRKRRHTDITESVTLRRVDRMRRPTLSATPRHVIPTVDTRHGIRKRTRRGKRNHITIRAGLHLLSDVARDRCPSCPAATPTQTPDPQPQQRPQPEAPPRPHQAPPPQPRPRQAHAAAPRQPVKRRPARLFCAPRPGGGDIGTLLIDLAPCSSVTRAPRAANTHPVFPSMSMRPALTGQQRARPHGRQRNAAHHAAVPSADAQAPNTDRAVL